MGDSGLVVLIIFVIIRLLIAVGLLYLVVYEIRKSRKHYASKYKETAKDANGQDVDRSSDSRG